MEGACPEVIHVKVGGMWFALDQETYLKMNSPVLNAIIHVTSPSSGNRKTKTNEFILNEADHESFTSFLVMTRYDTLPLSVLSSKEKRDKLLQESSFWGIRGAVERALEKAATEVKDINDLGNETRQVEAHTKTSQPGEASRVNLNCSEHHNQRKPEIAGISYGTFCTKCDFGEEKLVFLDGEAYSHCAQCRKQIPYQANLMWCHKCRCCVDCQREGCPGAAIPPNDRSVGTLFTNLEDKITALRDKS